MPILIGPFDQRGTASVVLPHVVADLLGPSEGDVIAAAPRAIDLRPRGGVFVNSYAAASAYEDVELVLNLAGAAVTWGAIDALASALDPAAAAQFRQLRETDPTLATHTVSVQTGSTSPLGYVPPVRTLFAGAQIEYRGVDLAYLSIVPHSSRMLLLEELAAANYIGLSSTENAQWLTDNGIGFVLEPPPLAAIDRVASLRAATLPANLENFARSPYLVVELDGGSAAGVDAARFGDQLARLASLTDCHLVVLLGGRSGTASFVRHLGPKVREVASVLVQPDPISVISLVQNCDGYIGGSVTGRTIAGGYSIARRSIAWSTSAQRARLDNLRRQWDPIGDDLIDDVAVFAEVGATLLADNDARRTTMRATTASAIEQRWARRTPTSDRPLRVGPPEGAALGGLLAVAERSAARARLVYATINRVVDACQADHHPPDPTDPAELFDAEWYRRMNPDLALAPGAELDHYLDDGWRDGRSPHPCFDPQHYLDQRPDLTDVEPFEHYLTHGWKEGRDPTVWFSTSYYLAHNPDVAENGREPLNHYLANGWRENRNPSAHFDEAWYRRAYPVPPETSGLIDHIRVGQYEGRVTVAPMTPTLIGRAESSTAATAALVHLHYPATWDDLHDVLVHVDEGTRIFVTITPNVDDATRARIVDGFPAAEVVRVDNLGRDSRPMLALLDRLIDEGFDAVLKIHGKQSPQLDFGDTWRRGLLRALCPSRSVMSGIGELFRTSPDLGVAIPFEFAQPLSYGLRDNRRGLHDSAQILAIDLDLDDAWCTSTTVFPRGSMYWFRPAALAALLRLDLDAFEPELGQTDGTLAHVVERLPGLVATAAGYDVIAFLTEAVDKPAPGAVATFPQRHGDDAGAEGSTIDRADHSPDGVAGSLQ